MDSDILIYPQPSIRKKGYPAQSEKHFHLTSEAAYAAKLTVQQEKALKERMKSQALKRKMERMQQKSEKQCSNKKGKKKKSRQSSKSGDRLSVSNSNN